MYKTDCICNSFANIHYHPPMELQEGNVFIHFCLSVCHSVHGGSPCDHYPSCTFGKRTVYIPTGMLSCYNEFFKIQIEKKLYEHIFIKSKYYSKIKHFSDKNKDFLMLFCLYILSILQQWRKIKFKIQKKVYMQTKCDVIGFIYELDFELYRRTTSNIMCHY